jgi:hypothetical protein
MRSPRIKQYNDGVFIEKERTRKDFLSRGSLPWYYSWCSQIIVLGSSTGSSAGWPLVPEYRVSLLAFAGGNHWQSAQPSHSCGTGTPRV